MWHKKLEQASIAHQTYRTLPIVSPKPKARHDLVTTVSYMNYNMDPTWNLCIGSRAPQHPNQLRPGIGIRPVSRADDERRLHRERKLNAAITGSSEVTNPIQQTVTEQQTPHCCCCNNLRREEELIARSNDTNRLANSMPAFDYRKYIELTRGRVN